jgi:hypothetical protein
MNWPKNATLSVLVLWVVTPCGLVGRYRRFGGTYCLCLQSYSVTTQKTNIDTDQVPCWGDGKMRRELGVCVSGLGIGKPSSETKTEREKRYWV